MKNIMDFAAVTKVGAHVIIRNNRVVGKCITHYGDSVAVALYDWTPEGDTGKPQRARASGYGYDKFTSALDGMTFAGIKLYDHAVNVRDKRVKRGIHTANGGASRFYDDGSNRLKAFGFTVARVL